MTVCSRRPTSASSCVCPTAPGRSSDGSFRNSTCALTESGSHHAGLRPGPRTSFLNAPLPSPGAAIGNGDLSRKPSQSARSISIFACSSPARPTKREPSNLAPEGKLSPVSCDISESPGVDIGFSCRVHTHQISAASAAMSAEPKKTRLFLTVVPLIARSHLPRLWLTCPGRATRAETPRIPGKIATVTYFLILATCAPSHCRDGSSHPRLLRRK